MYQPLLNQKLLTLGPFLGPFMNYVHSNAFLGSESCKLKIGNVENFAQIVFCLQAENIFNHMGPNMARGWECDSAGTKLKFSSSSVDNRTKQVLKVKSF